VDATYLSGSSGEGKVTGTKANPMDNPLQAHIINALADLPILEYRGCVFAKMVTNLRGDLARELL